jgi:predicted metal-dependent hydrolase
MTQGSAFEDRCVEVGEGQRAVEGRVSNHTSAFIVRRPRPSTAAASSAAASRASEAAERGDAECRRLKDSMLFAQAEVERLERLLESAQRQKAQTNNSAKSAGGTMRTDARMAKQNIEAESDSLYDVLTSPRDKPVSKSRPGTSRRSRPPSGVNKKKDANKNAWL